MVVKNIYCGMLYDEDILWSGKIIVEETGNFEGILDDIYKTYINGTFTDKGVYFCLTNNKIVSMYDFKYSNNIDNVTSYIGLCRDDIGTVKKCELSVEKTLLNNYENTELVKNLNFNKELIKKM